MGFERRWGNKSGIWRFYRRVWKNIFYEGRDKEKRDGVLEGWRNLYFFKNFQRGGEEFETLWVNVFLGYGVGRERERGGECKIWGKVFGLSGRWDVIWNIP